MLEITIPAIDLYDETREEFVKAKEQTLRLEHSLVSLSKWEAKWHKPFLGREEKTDEESLDYFRCMTITQNVDPLVYFGITKENIKAINAYLEDPMTATTLKKLPGGKGSREIATSEVIYYWMFSLDIPIECEKWNLNRLFTQIEVCNRKNAPAKKMSKKDEYSQRAALNASRKQQLGTRG